MVALPVQAAYRVQPGGSLTVCAPAARHPAEVRLLKCRGVRQLHMHGSPSGNIPAKHIAKAAKSVCDVYRQVLYD